MKSRILAKLVFILAVAPGAAAAQVDVPETLRLEDALRIARANNPEFLAVLNDEEVAASEVRTAWGSLLPSLSAGMNWNLRSSTTVTGEDDFGEPVRLPDARTYQSSSAGQSIGANVTLFDGGRNLRTLTTARANAALVDATIANRRSALATTVTNAFFNAVQSLRLVEVEERNLDAARDRQDRTRAQFEIATASQVDILGAQRSVLDAQRRLRQQQGAAEQRRLLLAFTLGIDPETPFELDTAVPEVFDPATLDAEALVARAASVHPRLLEAQARLRAASARTSSARGRRWPTISANFSFSRGTSRSGYEAFGELNPLNRGWGGGLSFNVPIFSGFATSHEIAQAEAGEQDARYEQRRAQLQVEQEVRAALVDLQTAYDALQLANEIAAITDERLTMAEEQYRIGALDFLQLQQLIDENLNAQRQAVDAQFTFITARATLEEKLGGPIQQ